MLMIPPVQTTNIRTASDYRPLAMARLHPDVWRYLEEGAGDQAALAANRRALDAVPLLPRPLADVRGGHTRVTLFGETLEHPLLLAPVAYQRLFHADGERASAMAVAAQGGQMAVSSLASQTLETIAEAAARPLWFQLYWQGDRARTLRLLRRAEVAGYRLVMLTVDAPVKQSTIPLPPGIRAVNLEEGALRLSPLEEGRSQVFDGWMAHAPTWDDLAWLRDQTRLPLVVKGVMHPDDARRAVDLGCNGVVVSNHGGRVLDGVPAAIDMLPAIVAAVERRATVLFDSGVRSGRDAYRALMLGAAAVMVGRPAMWGLAVSGAMGVAHVLRLMRDELEMTMALCGQRTLDARIHVDLKKGNTVCAF
jgi:4-hydroxymandelate oxidase